MLLFTESFSGIFAELEEATPISKRKKMFASLGLDEILDFDRLDPGFAGGHQVFMDALAEGI